MRKNSLVVVCLLVAVGTAASWAQAPGQEQQPEFVKQARELLQQGKLNEALGVYQKESQASPGSGQANIGAGSVLDLMGRGKEARMYFSKAIETAATPAAKASAQRAMAMSYAFEGNCAKAIDNEQPGFELWRENKDFFRGGEVANEAARVCIDAGDLEAASKWYKIGHDTGLMESNITPARRDLWEFRWEHAQARIAARRGDRVEAQKHVAAAKAVLDKGTNPEQAVFFPYLQGYVAFYSGDYKVALEHLKQANQNDPFIQVLMAQAYEKLGDKVNATEFYRKAASATGHNPAAAYAVPLAKKKLAGLGG